MQKHALNYGMEKRKSKNNKKKHKFIAQTQNEYVIYSFKNQRALSSFDNAFVSIIAYKKLKQIGIMHTTQSKSS